MRLDQRRGRVFSCRGKLGIRRAGGRPGRDGELARSGKLSLNDRLHYQPTFSGDERRLGDGCRLLLASCGRASWICGFSYETIDVTRVAIKTVASRDRQAWKEARASFDD